MQPRALLSWQLGEEGRRRRRVESAARGEEGVERGGAHVGRVGVGERHHGVLEHGEVLDDRRAVRARSTTERVARAREGDGDQMWVGVRVRVEVEGEGRGVGAARTR